MKKPHPRAAKRCAQCGQDKDRYVIQVLFSDPSAMPSSFADMTAKLKKVLNGDPSVNDARPVHICVDCWKLPETRTTLEGLRPRPRGP